MTSIITELASRDLIFQVTNQDLDKIFSSDKPPVYCGFDPTSSSLHLGSLLPIIGLMRFQQAGFKPIIVIGGATGMIGDPSGKSSERVLLGEEDIAANAAAIEAQLRRFLDFDKGSCSAQVVNNASWFNQILFVDFLRDIGKHFSIGVILAKESVKTRLETGISFTEFSYILLQAYDFLYLYDNYKCKIQLGGQDQWGNITAGIELIRRLRGQEVFGVTLPLVTTASGKKFGKSEAGNIWLDGALTSPYQLYQYLINVSDQDVITYLKIFTFLSLEKLVEYTEKIRNKPEERESQKLLAWEVTRLVHGKEAAFMAQKASEALFGGEISGFTDKILEEIFFDVPKAKLLFSALAGGLDLIESLLSCQAVSSKGEAKRLIGQGGVYVNNQKVNDQARKLTTQDLASEHFIVIRTGKKKFFILGFE
ncbi:MAG: tyrosine--tRNA ligase [Thermodesulfobacteriota bacterium]|jgi:tyrosyl-tRNA synthetase|nr:MAG: tyrosine--tRNA ligase [Thermodesulfobacteriota bacterium]